MRNQEWFTPSPDVPTRWFPRKDLDPESFAIGVLFGGKPDDDLSRKIGVDAWFDRPEAGHYEVREQTIRTGDGRKSPVLLLTST